MNRTVLKHLLVFAPPLVLILALVLQPWVEPLWAFQDPIVAAQSSGACCSAYFGFVSNLGVVYWVTAAAALTVAAFALKAAGSPKRAVAFMVSGALLTAALGLDDLLLLHERILPKLGLPQTLILGAYAAAGLAYFIVFLRDLRQRDFSILCIGLAALVVSLGIDVVFDDQTDAMKVAEDCAKFIGIAGWAGFHWIRSITAVTDLAAGRSGT